MNIPLYSGNSISNACSIRSQKAKGINNKLSWDIPGVLENFGIWDIPSVPDLGIWDSTLSQFFHHILWDRILGHPNWDWE